MESRSPVKGELRMTVDELRKKYTALFGEEPAAHGIVSGIEAALNITLPSDFKAIADFYRGGMLGGISHFAIACQGPAENIVEETLRLRSAITLPGQLVVIAEPPESLVVLDTAPKSNGPC